MKEVEVTFGQVEFNDKKELNFPPENAKRKSTPKENYVEVDLVESKDKKNNSGMDR